MMISPPMSATRMKISPSTCPVEYGISMIKVKILVVASPDVCKIGMVSWATVGALVSKPQLITSGPPSTSKLVSAGVTKSSLYLSGITKEVNYHTKKVRSSIRVFILLKQASMRESMDTNNS